MRKFFTCIFTFISIILAGLFVITSLLTLMIVNMERHVFDTRFYNRALMENNLYERMPALAGEMIMAIGGYNPCIENPLACKIDNASPELQTCLKNAIGEKEYQAIGTNQRKPTENELQLAQPCLDQFAESESEPTEPGPDMRNGAPEYMKNLAAKDYETIITLLLPPADMKTLVEEALAQVFQYLDGKNNSAIISLVALKERISSQAGFEVVMHLLQAQPPCTIEQIAQFTVGFVSGQSDMVFCNPPQDLIDVITPEIQAQLTQIVLTIPDEAVFIKPYISTEEMESGSGSGGPFGNDPFTTIHFARMIMRFSYILPASILLLITLLVVRSLKGWLHWWGFPLLISGMLGILLGFAFSPAFNYIFHTFLAQKIPGLVPQNTVNLGLDILHYLLRDLSSAVEIQALIITLAGFGLVLASLFIKTQPGNSEIQAIHPIQHG
ncbi:MAG: hypothetical protein MUP03_08185 [Anaerolineales bacterium]|nr:hypothetical protein [Anaerolineales bacterium]